MTLSKVKTNYDFAGWVTKHDIKCSDGVTIKHNAFSENDGSQVPLVWNHDYNNPENVLGHVVLEAQEQGVYGYGFFNDTESGQNANKLVKHGDISSMSIGARKLSRNGSDVVKGSIYEVSLVLAAANPGAMIETVLTHGDDNEEKAIIHTGTLIHSSDDILKGGEKMDEEEIQHKDKSIKDIVATMNNDQKNALYALLGMVAESKKEEEEGSDMKHNVFNQTTTSEDVLIHSLNGTLKTAVAGKASSLKDVLQAAKESGDETLKHGINSIEMLFPEAAHSTNGNVPIIYKDPNTKYKAILNSVTKTPFANVRTMVADLTEEEARAKGYIKGNFKKEEFFSLIKRVTGPTTIYKKQKLDRDDIIDIEDFNVVAFLQSEMRMMLEEEIARAVLIGDGRDVSDEDKIDETRIRPVISDHEFFTIHKTYANPAGFVESVLLAMKEYRGSGSPTMYIDPALLIAVKLLKGTDGRYLNGHIPTNSELASMMGLSSIEETSFMAGKGALIVNLRDYNLGAAKGGQITNFDDFDIDFNQYKYLIETRLSGALTMPKSAIHLAQGTAGKAANDTEGGMTYGQRQADKPVTPPTGD